MPFLKWDDDKTNRWWQKAFRT